MAIKRGLGRGLDALYDNTEAAEAEQKDLIELRISMIEPNHDQPRKDFDEDALITLSNSIAEHGIIQPIILQNNCRRKKMACGKDGGTARNTGNSENI